WLERLDGLLLTGAYSNIEPHHYSGESSWEGNTHDPARDANTLSLVRQAIAMKVPVLAICRGLQEVNVALGGSLYQSCMRSPSWTSIARTVMIRSGCNTRPRTRCSWL